MATTEPLAVSRPIMIFTVQIDEHDSAPARMSKSHIYEKTFLANGSPGIGDGIEAWEDGWLLKIVGRWWDHNGHLNLQLRRITYLPTDLGEEYIEGMKRFVTGPMAWRESDEEVTTLFELLEDAGWTKPW